MRIAKSKDHVCFGRRVAGRLVACSIVDAEEEFVTDETGAILASCAIDAKFLEATGQRMWKDIHCAKATLVAAFCRNVGIDVPKATAGLVIEEKAAARKHRQEAADKAAEGRRRIAMAKGKSKGKTIIGHWDHLFQKNEERAAAHAEGNGPKPWTDDELVALMKAEFPEHKGKTTLERPRMFRMHYNTGKFSFEKLGSAKSRKLPESRIYDAEGKAVPKGTRQTTIRGETKAAAKQPAGRKSVEKKRVVRRAAKRGSSSRVKKATKA